MRQQKTDRGAIDSLRNHFIGKLIPGVGTWGELDILRGWKDDFMGKVLHEQYTEQTAGAGSGAQLQPDFHGGIYNMWTGAVIGAYRRIWLGDAADGFATLAADQGWLMMARMQLLSTTNVRALFGAERIGGGGSIIIAGIMTDVVANNWVLRARNAGGAFTTVDSGIAADTNMHWHYLDVRPIAGGLRQVDYYLAGSRIATTTVNVPTALLTPQAMVYAVAAAVRNILLDAWMVIPRNLA